MVKDLDFGTALSILSKLPATEVNVLMQDSADRELLANALADVETMEIIGLDATKWVLLVGIMQAAYYLGYRRGKKERQMPEFIVGGPNENQETR